MTAALDMGLPTDQQLAAAATPNPHAEAARLAAADPGLISELGTAFLESSAELDAVYGHSQQAQRRLAGGFGNNGDPVYDEGTHRAALPPGFRDAGPHLHELGRRLAAVAEELISARTDIRTELARLQTDLNTWRRSWAAELEALGGPDRLFPPEAIAGLLSRRNTIAALMQEAVNAGGRAVIARIEWYSVVLNGCLRLLGDLAYLRAGLATDARSVRLDGVLRPAPDPAGPPRPAVGPISVPTAGGPRVEIFPRIEGGRLEGVILGSEPAPGPERGADTGQRPAAGDPGDSIAARDPGPPTTPPGEIAAPGPEATETTAPPPKSVDETLDGLPEGDTTPHREVDSPAALETVWNELSAGATPVPSTYPGRFEELPDGTKIGYRESSKSGGPTIDVFKPDGTHVKVHLG